MYITNVSSIMEITKIVSQDFLVYNNV